VKEIQRESSQQKRREPRGELGEVLSSISGIEMNESWIREEIWIREPSHETVERLIEWLSDESH